MSWTDARVELLKTLWQEGLSASQIAARIGNVTRNAVIGKMHRLNLSGRVRSVARSRRKVAAPAPKPKTMTLPTVRKPVRIPKSAAAPRLRPAAVPLVAPVSLRVGLMDLKDSMCKWPEGDPRTPEFSFCGHARFNSLPYCEYHCRVATSDDRSRTGWTDERRDQARAAARKRWFGAGGAAA